MIFLISTSNNSGKKIIRKRLLAKIARRLIAVGLILCGVLFLIDIRIRPIVEKTAEYQSRNLAVHIINQAVFDEVSSELFQYQNLINLYYDENGSISSIETNMVNVNKLKTLVTQSINDDIKSISNHELSINIGTVSGIQMLYGKGFTFSFHVEPSGYVETSLVSSFEESGINQTLHRIVLHVETVVSTIIPGYSDEISVEADFVIAETVIVGNVPGNYTRVITGNEDLLSKINDYGG